MVCGGHFFNAVIYKIHSNNLSMIDFYQVEHYFNTRYPNPDETFC